MIKNKSFIMIVASSLLAGTLIFLGVFWALKPDQGKNSAVQEDQILEREFQESKAQFATFDIDQFHGCDFAIYFEKTQRQKQYQALKENYQTIKTAFDKYEKFVQAQKAFFKKLIQDTKQFMKSFRDFIVDYDQEYQNFLKRKFYLFKSLENLALDFWEPQQQTAFRKNITDLKNNFNRVFDQHKYHLNEQKIQEYQDQSRNEIYKLADHFKHAEQAFNHAFLRMKHQLENLKEHVKVDHNYVNQFNLTALVPRTMRTQMQKINQDYVDLEKNNCTFNQTARFAQKKCVAALISNYQSLNQTTSNLTTHLNQIVQENNFNVTVGQINERVDSLTKNYVAAKEVQALIAMVQKEMVRIKNIQCDVDLACWRKKNNQIKDLVLSKEHVEVFIDNLNHIQKNNQALYDLVTPLKNRSFFNNSEIVKQLTAKWQNDDYFKLFQALKYQSWLPDNYRFLQETRLFTKENDDYLQIVNETNNLVEYQKKIARFIDDTFIQGKPFYSYLNWKQIIGVVAFDVCKFYTATHYVPTILATIFNDGRFFEKVRYFNFAFLFLSNIYYLFFNPNDYFNDTFYHRVEYQDVFRNQDWSKLIVKLSESYELNTLFLWQKVEYVQRPNDATELAALETKRIISSSIYWRAQISQLFSSLFGNLGPFLIVILTPKSILKFAHPLINQIFEEAFQNFDFGKSDYGVVVDFNFGSENLLFLLGRPAVRIKDDFFFTDARVVRGDNTHIQTFIPTLISHIDSLVNEEIQPLDEKKIAELEALNDFIALMIKKIMADKELAAAEKENLVRLKIAQEKLINSMKERMAVTVKQTMNNKLYQQLKKMHAIVKNYYRTLAECLLKQNALRELNLLEKELAKIKDRLAKIRAINENGVQEFQSLIEKIDQTEDLTELIAIKNENKELIEFYDDEYSLRLKSSFATKLRLLRIREKKKLFLAAGLDIYNCENIFVLNKYSGNFEVEIAILNFAYHEIGKIKENDPHRTKKIKKILDENGIKEDEPISLNKILNSIKDPQEQTNTKKYYEENILIQNSNDELRRNPSIKEIQAKINDIKDPKKRASIKANILAILEKEFQTEQEQFAEIKEWFAKIKENPVTFPATTRVELNEMLSQLDVMSSYYSDSDNQAQKTFCQNILSAIKEMKKFDQMILDLMELEKEIHYYNNRYLKRQKKVNFIKEEKIAQEITEMEHQYGHYFDVIEDYIAQLKSLIATTKIQNVSEIEEDHEIYNEIAPVNKNLINKILNAIYDEIEKEPVPMNENLNDIKDWEKKIEIKKEYYKNILIRDLYDEFSMKEIKKKINDIKDPQEKIKIEQTILKVFQEEFQTEQTQLATIKNNPIIFPFATNLILNELTLNDMLSKFGMMSNYYSEDEEQKAFEQNILSKIIEIKEFKQMILDLIKLRNKIYNYDLKRQKKVIIKEEERNSIVQEIEKITQKYNHDLNLIVDYINQLKRLIVGIEIIEEAEENSDSD